MANSLREVKQRITSTKNTAQITKAMYMVSSSKSKKAVKNYNNYQDFMQRKATLVKNVIYKAEDYVHPLMDIREINNTCYLLITSDRGLAGAYNQNIYKALETRMVELKQTKDNVICGAIGKQGYGYLNRKSYKMIFENRTLIRDDVMFIDILPIARKCIQAFLNKEIDELVIVYNHYINSLTQEVVFKQLLPINSIEKEESKIDYVYENGVEKTLDSLLPMYIEDMIYGYILDAKASEHSARMNSMRNATDNASEVIDDLQLLYNSARQSQITTELIDIISGANAIGGENQ